MRRQIRLASTASALALFAAAGCKDFLSVEPVTQVRESEAIVDARSARAAAAGMYDELQSTDFYGGDYTLFMDLSGPDVIHTGTFTSYADADDNNLSPDNESVSSIWAAAYVTIGRANGIIQKLPAIAMDSVEKANRLGEAYFIRALVYHDLVTLFGQPGGLGVPVRLAPPASIQETFDVKRETTDSVYRLILADLARAEPLLVGQKDRHRATVTAVRALRSRVLLWRQDWAGTVAAADSILKDSVNYKLAPKFGDLFTAGVANTPENIFQLSFTVADASNLGYYYISKPLGGRREVAPTAALFAAYSAKDSVRRNVTLKPRNATSYYGAKYPSVAGDDDYHVIRLAEVILNHAEASAHLNQLATAKKDVDRIRTRAGLDTSATLTFATQGSALAEIFTQRRLELALEGFRWLDLVRTGQAAATYGTQSIYPIPQSEIDVTKKGSLVQNPGY